MKINKNELKNALEIVKPGLANKEIIDQSTSFAFMNDCIVTYNDEISVSHPVKDLNIQGAVKAEELYKFLSKIKTEEIDIEVTENELNIKSGKASAGFALTQEILLPINEELSGISKFKNLPEKFIVQLKTASLSCSQDLTEPKLTCVHVNQEGFIEASDNLRVSHFKTEKLPVKTFLIPYTSVNVVAKLEPVKIAESNSWIHFKNTSGTTISCRKLADTFVDTKPYLNISKGIKIKFPKSLNEVLECAFAFQTKESKNSDYEYITLELTNNLITVSARNDTSWFSEPVPTRYKDKEFAFMITKQVFKEVLQNTTECIYNEEKHILKFESEDWIYLTSIIKK